MGEKKINKKKNIMREIVAKRCSTKKLLESLSNTVKGLHAVRLTTLLKRNPRTGVLELAVRQCSLK